MNSIPHEEMTRRSRQAALATYVARLDAEFGEPDPDEVERFRRALASTPVLDSEAFSAPVRSWSND